MDNEEIQAALKNGRDFIKAVLNLSGANPSQTVQKKYFEGLEPENESQKYTSYGKYNNIPYLDILMGLIQFCFKPVRLYIIYYLLNFSFAF